MTYQDLKNKAQGHLKKVKARSFPYRQKLISKVHRAVEKATSPSDELLVSSLIMNCQNMGLELGSYVEFAPTSREVLQPFRLYGTSLPVFSYSMFYKHLMEFVDIRVYLSKPDRILFHATICSRGTADDRRHGEEIPVVEEFKKPFFVLARHLYHYFPHYQDPSSKKD